MRLALFGGTFDPIHCGHVQAARAAADEHALDRVLVVPCGRPPHKSVDCRASYEDRVRMAQLACVADPRLETGRVEEPLPSGEPNFTIETIRHVQSTLAFEPPLRFIIGADAFAEFGHWRSSDEIRQLVEFLVVSRPGAAGSVPGDLAGLARKPVHCSHPASSQLVRHRAKIGGSLADLAPPAVCRYIWEHSLYRA